MNKLNLSIAICTINPDICLRLLKSLMNFINKNDQIIVLVDGRIYIDHTKPEFLSFCQKYNIEVIINDENIGLSYCRNKAMQIAKNQYIVFFDDDTILLNNTLEHFRQSFIDGKTVGGARLTAPEHYKRKMGVLSEGYSYVFGIHSCEEKIWGACFGFDVNIAKENNLYFEPLLGRKGRGLQSGDDTLFVKEYLNISNNPFFINYPVQHCFNPNRLTVKYILRRVFWQGRSEIRRSNFKLGWQKEKERSKNNHNMLQIFTSLCLRFTFLLGAFVEQIQHSVRRDS